MSSLTYNSILLHAYKNGEFQGRGMRKHGVPLKIDYAGIVDYIGREWTIFPDSNLFNDVVSEYVYGIECGYAHTGVEW